MKINLSQKFEVKPRGAECAKIVFTEHEITSVAAFLFECCSGRAVCPLFKKEDGATLLRIAEKRDERFIKSHTIFLDFDNEQQTPQELISTFLYEQYKKVSSFDSLDACSIKTSQMCFGSSNPLSIFNNNEKIFSGAEHFFQLEAFQQWAMEREEECSSTEEKHAHKSSKGAKNEGGNSYINYTMCNDYENMPWNEFAEKWGVDGYEKGWVNYRLEHEGWNFSPDSKIAYQFVNPEKYFQMPYIIHRGHYNNMSSETMKHWLLQTMSCYKLLNPRCDLNRILFRVLQKIELQNIDPEHLLTARDLISVMEEVDSYTEEDIEERYKKRLEYLKETSRPKSGIIIKKSKANRDVGYSTLLSQVKRECVLDVISGQESPQEALAIVEQNEKTKRLGIKLKWMETFFTEMGFAQEKKMVKLGLEINAIKDLIKEHGKLSIRKMLSLLEEKGIIISRGTLCKRLKDLQNCN